MEKNTDIRMSGYTFRKEREAGWIEIEAILDKLENSRRGALTENELLRLPVLYISLLSSLSVARDIALDRALLRYLENLAKRAYLTCYAERVRWSFWVRNVLLRDIPLAIADFKWIILLPVVLMFMGFLTGEVLYPYYRFQLGSFIKSDFSLLFNVVNTGRPAAITFVLLAIAASIFLISGLAYGIVTFIYLFIQGMTLGVLVHLPGEVWYAYVPELLSLILTGAAGFYFADRLLFGKKYDRTYSPPAICAKAVPVALLGIVAFPLNYLLCRLLSGLESIGGLLLAVFWAGLILMVNLKRKKKND